jgi:hypothetical protein
MRKALLALALIVAGAFAMPAAPAAAWDTDIFIECKTDPHIPVDYDNGQSIKWRWTDKPQEATLIVFFDKERVEEHGRSERYHFRTEGRGCKLYYDERENKGYVAVKSHVKRGKFSN